LSLRISLQGYFNGATAPWLELGAAPPEGGGMAGGCAWSDEQKGMYLAGCAAGCKAFTSLAGAKAACEAEASCGGVTKRGGADEYELRAGSSPAASPAGELSWSLTNAGTPACHPPQPVVPDPTWMRRGAAAYGGLNRTDPHAVWSFQGWAFVGWKSQEQAQSLRGFIDATPKNKFVVIDMSVNGEGEWKKWGGASYWGAPFIWTTLARYCEPTRHDPSDTI
jgi:hypothetical protein